MAYFGMPSALRSSIENSLGMEVAEGMAQNWNLVVMGCMLFGIIVVISAMNSVYKRYRFNRPDYMDGAVLKFISGILLVNINWLVMAVVSYA
jgi:hypothetical protein